MSLDREALEKLALEICSPAVYYDLADNINESTEAELEAIIQANGDFRAELIAFNENPEEYDA